jgi:single-stranded-DNA-specific exonuclease
MQTVSMRGMTVWNVAPRDPGAEATLVRELGTTPALAAALVARGVTDPGMAEKILTPDLGQLHSPWKLPDIRPAVDALGWARENRHGIFVHGDYDVDGVTSAALFTRFLRRVGCQVTAHVPHRVREGYGIHQSAVDSAVASGAKVFLTCDCGTGAVEQVRAAREAGMRVIVTDHHQAPSAIPEAEAVVNPQRSGHDYPWKELSGVGVAMKVAAAFAEEIGAPVDKFYRAYLDFAALGTIADLMPLLDENRVIASLGLERLGATQKAGLRALIEVSGLGAEPRINARHVGFVLGPRINAVGRIAEPESALNLLLSDDREASLELARHLESVNEQRKEEQRTAVEQAVELVDAQVEEPGPIVVAISPDWHSGIVGLVAGRLLERYRRPAFAARVEDGFVKGSARSIPGFDVGQALHSMRDMLVSGGGHALAAGFTVAEESFPKFVEELTRMAGELLGEEDFVPTLRLDGCLSAAEAAPENGADLERLEPFGQSWPKPIFGVQGLKLLGMRRTSNPAHARATFDTGAGVVTAIAFGQADHIESLGAGTPVSAAVEFDQNSYNGTVSWRWIVKDVSSAS